MDISAYLSQDEINELNHAFEISLQHDSVLVFWTGISPSLAKDWAHGNGLKTLTMAMGPLYTDNKRRSQKSRQASKSWSGYMKGASWVFAQHACHDRYAVVLTNAPPNIYSTRKHSNYREIEEPVLKGLGADQHTIQIDYIHPTVPGAERFQYQTWPNNRSSDWLAFLQCIAPRNVMKKVQELKHTKVLDHESADSSYVALFVTEVEDIKQQFRSKRKVAKLRLEGEQLVAQGKKAVKQRKVEEEKQAAEEKKAAKRLKVEREQLVAQEKKAAKQRKVEEEKQAANEKKAAKRLKVEREQLVAQEKKRAKQAKVEREKQAAQKKKAAKQLKVEKEKQAAQEKKAAKRLKVEKEKQAAQEKKAAKRLQVGGK